MFCFVMTAFFWTFSKFGSCFRTLALILVSDFSTAYTWVTILCLLVSGMLYIVLMEQPAYSIFPCPDGTACPFYFPMSRWNSLPILFPHVPMEQLAHSTSPCPDGTACPFYFPDGTACLFYFPMSRWNSLPILFPHVPMEQPAHSTSPRPDGTACPFYFPTSRWNSLPILLPHVPMEQPAYSTSPRPVDFVLVERTMEQVTRAGTWHCGQVVHAWNVRTRDWGISSVLLL